MRLLFTACACLIANALFCQFVSDSTCIQNCEHPGYNLMTQNIDGQNITREYILHVPTGYDSSEDYPLVILFHGFGGCAFDWYEMMEYYYGFNDLADEQGFLVAYPQAAYRPQKEDVYWEPGDIGGEHIYNNDIYFVQELINHISNGYSIDNNRVYGGGYSNGGMMVYSVACTRGDLMSAIGVMSGAMLDSAGDCDTSIATPVIIFHGVGDSVLPYNGDQYYSSVSDVVNIWLNHNGILQTSLVSSVSSNGNVIHDAYSGGNNGTCLSLYTVVEEYGQPGGHEWFSEDIDGVSPSRILWDFFNEGCNGAMEVELINEETIDKKLEKIVDALGREVNHTTHQILFYIYDDGSVEKKFIFE